MSLIGVKRVDHVSYTVSDLEKSIAFWAAFGFATVNRYICAGPETDAGLDTENAEVDIQLLRRPDGFTLELIRYTQHPTGTAVRNAVVGSAHVAFIVEDIDAAYAQLSGAGLDFLSSVNTDQYGEKWVYLRDPDGITVELMQPNADSQRAIVSQQAA